jgi:small GTP-binding protein
MRPVKLITLGSEFVGKTCLIDRWVSSTYRSDNTQTTHAGYVMKSLSIKGDELTFQLWDTAGDERYRTMTSAYCRNAMGALLVFDRTSQLSFNALSDWLCMLRESSGEDVTPVILVGNKSDLAPVVPTLLIAEFCAENGNIQYFETSALNGQNVDDAFQALCELAATAHARHTQVVSGVDISLRTAGISGRPSEKADCC